VSHHIQYANINDIKNVDADGSHSYFSEGPVTAEPKP